MKQLNCKKATDPDEIPAIVLKHCAPKLAPWLNRLFKMSYELETFPSLWKAARVQPIPKKKKKVFAPKLPSNCHSIFTIQNYGVFH